MSYEFFIQNSFVNYSKNYTNGTAISWTIHGVCFSICDFKMQFNLLSHTFMIIKK